jgi:hypothetical protein
MDQPPALDQLGEQEQEALMSAWWAEVQRVPPRLAEREAQRQEPVTEARQARVPPAQPHNSVRERR